MLHSLRVEWGTTLTVMQRITNEWLHPKTEVAAPDLFDCRTYKVKGDTNVLHVVGSWRCCQDNKG